MTKSSNKPTVDQGDERPYEVGYGRPPKHTRIKPGEVRNPRGRPKGQRNAATVLRETLNQRVQIREGGRTRTVTKLAALFLKMINDASLGNPKAQTNALAAMRAAGLVEAPTTPQAQEAPITADDQSLITDFYERHRHRLAYLEKPVPPTNQTKESSDKGDVS